MNEHVTVWLEAYHDGELRGRRLRQVEDHLAYCAACRAELAKLRKLTALLQESPAAEILTSPERFVAQVGLRLPRRPAQPTWQRALEVGWRLIPVGLLGAWAFTQAAFFVAEVVLLALRVGPGGDLIASLLPASQRGWWLTELIGLSSANLGNVGQVMLRSLSNGGPLGWSIMLHTALLTVIGLLYLSWLVSWWARLQRRQI